MDLVASFSSLGICVDGGNIPCNKHVFEDPYIVHDHIIIYMGFRMVEVRCGKITNGSIILLCCLRAMCHARASRVFKTTT